MIAIFHFLIFLNYWNLNSESHCTKSMIAQVTGYIEENTVKIKHFNLLREHLCHIKQILFTNSKFSHVIKMQSHWKKHQGGQINPLPTDHRTRNQEKLSCPEAWNSAWKTYISGSNVQRIFQRCVLYLPESKYKFCTYLSPNKFIWI